MRTPTTHVALLPAVNLGGHNRVAMADLRELLAELGMAEPRSLLRSGKLVFRSEPGSTAELERLLEEAAAERLGLETDFFVRTVAEWRRIAVPVATGTRCSSSPPSSRAEARRTGFPCARGPPCCHARATLGTIGPEQDPRTIVRRDRRWRPRSTPVPWTGSKSASRARSSGPGIRSTTRPARSSTA